MSLVEIQEPLGDVVDACDKTQIKRVVGRPFQIGNPGGPGRPKTRHFSDEIRRQHAEDPSNLEGVIRGIWDLAKSGEGRDAIAAAEFLRDTIGEKPANVVTGDDEAPPIILEIVGR